MDIVRLTDWLNGHFYTFFSCNFQRFRDFLTFSCIFMTFYCRFETLRDSFHWLLTSLMRLMHFFLRMLVFEDASIAKSALPPHLDAILGSSVGQTQVFFHIAEVKHVLNSAFKKRRCKFGFWNLTAPIDHPTYVQKSNIPLYIYSAFLSPVCLKNTVVVFETVERSLFVLKMNFAESWWRICPDRQDLISSPFGGLGWNNFHGLGRKTIPKRWGVSNQWKKWGPSNPPFIHFTDAVAMFW